LTGNGDASMRLVINNSLGGSTGPETESDVCALPCAGHYGTQEYVVQSSAKVYYSNTVLCY